MLRFKRWGSGEPLGTGAQSMRMEDVEAVHIHASLVIQGSHVTLECFDIALRLGSP